MQGMAKEQRLETGYWILTDAEWSKVWHCNCSKCGKDPLYYFGGSDDVWLIKSYLPKFCPSCGTKMIGYGTKMIDEVEICKW